MGDFIKNPPKGVITEYIPGSPESYNQSNTAMPSNATISSKNSIANEGINELMKRNYNGTLMSWRPETRNYQLGNIYDYSVYKGRNNHRWGGTMNSSSDPYSAALAAANASGGKYLVGYYKPENWYYLYDNPNYAAPAPAPAPAPTPTYTTDANKKPVNNGTTAGTQTSVIKLNPHQQYLLNQQNAAKQQLTNALADYAKKVFNSSYQPEKSEATRLRTFSEVMRELNKTDLSGAFSTARDFVNKTNDVYNTAAEQYKKAMANGAPKSDWAYRKQIQDALMDYQESRLNPTYAKQADDLAVKLANQGITQGSNTYGSEWDIYHRAKNDAYQSAYNNAIAQGEQAIQNQFNRDMQTYKQYANNYDLAAKYRDMAGDNLNNVYSLDVQQNAALNNSAIGLMGAYQANQQRAQQQALETRQQQLNELMSLMQLTAPTMPTFSNQQTAGNVAPGDYIGAATGLYGGLGGAAANGAAQQQAAQQSRNNFFGDLIGAGIGLLL